MDFSMPFLKKQNRSIVASLLIWFLPLSMLLASLLVASSARAQNSNAYISAMQLSRSETELFLNAQIAFEMSPIVQDALTKGVPLIFTAEAEITRDRWYWYDKTITIASRVMRLSYQPLTRRWRVNVGTGGVSLPQYFESLNDALASIKRFNRWRVADLAEIDPTTAHTIQFKFKLDLSELPRPFQIGLIGNNEWLIETNKSMRFVAESIK
jgi:hypothetical protein|uniref:Putative proline rich signal peptide protein n=1 Tax=uncultured bacterium A1Q1_fos_1266 TaxID=1256546 RepID=L7W168_9BACT|nr:putative proline rich signal peptide protein [uncultured bacterium A1Q1_fos_1266]